MTNKLRVLRVTIAMWYKKREREREKSIKVKGKENHMKLKSKGQKGKKMFQCSKGRKKMYKRNERKFNITTLFVKEKKKKNNICIYI